MNASAACAPELRLRVGLTGGIGSGKTTAAACFESLGVPVIDADIVAREVVAPGTPALAAIAEHFGTACLLPSGELDRAAVRLRVFAEPAERQWLEALLHPLIRIGIEQQLADALRRPDAPYAILSSPLLLETGQDALVHRILLIDASEAQQRERTLRRDGSDARTVEAIIAAQLPREQRRARADDTILNDGDLPQLQNAVRTLHAHYLALAANMPTQENTA